MPPQLKLGDPRALAAFVTRPQAVLQIGAAHYVSQIILISKNVFYKTVIRLVGMGVVILKVPAY